MSQNWNTFYGSSDLSSCISPAVIFRMLHHSHMQLFGVTEIYPGGAERIKRTHVVYSCQKVLIVWYIFDTRFK